MYCLFLLIFALHGVIVVSEALLLLNSRYLGVLLYDADRIAEAAAVEREQDLYPAQLSLFLDPNDPKVIEQARRDGVPEAVLDEQHAWAAVRGLPQRQRLAVAYHHLGGLPYAEVAALIGGTPEAARRAAADGIARLRREGSLQVEAQTLTRSAGTP